MDIAEWREVSYKKIFESTVNFIRKQKAKEGKFKIEDLEAMLQTEYDRQGLAWDGRGEVVEIGIEATIAAIQQELVTWRKNLRVES